ncbi:MAG: TonB-dependent receptor [Chitinophagaceae bacterium]|nr:TonB-dependent receptor [Chitinophagaceae bacterium]
MRKIHLLFMTILIVSAVQSQSVRIAPAEDTTKPKELDVVVVTGQYKPQSAKNSVYQVRTITAERIQKQGAVNLQTVLNNELNIRFSQDLATGGSDITMMGLKGQNVKILVDGLPMTGRQGTSNEININQVDINSIERIEIVEGPMSVVYGADALAGVINIITKKSKAAKYSVTARLHEETIGSEFGLFDRGIHNQYVGVTAKHKNWEFGGSFGHNYFGGWKDTATGRELVWHKKDQLLANGFIGYSKDKFSIRYRLDGLDEIITNPGNFQQFPDQISGEYFAYDQEYLTSRLMHQLQGSYFVNSNLNFQLQTSYTDYSRQVFSTTVSKQTGKVSLDIGTGRQSIIDFTGFTLRGIVNYKLSKIFSLQPGIDINLDRGEGERLKAGSNTVDDYAFFLTSEITPSEKINIRPGLRVIKNSVYDAPPVIPSLNTKFALTKNLDLRLAYARGFRSPSLRELYFNFFDANHQIIGNPDLKAETSHSFTGSLNWKKITSKEVVYTTVLGGFYNSVKNLIDYAVSPTNQNVFQLTNVSDSRTAGANLSTVARYKTWNISVGASYTGFYNDYSETDDELPQLQWSAEVNSSVGYTFSKISLDVSLFYKFTGKRPYYTTNSSQQVVLGEQKDFHMADLTFNKKAFKYLSFNAGIRNLFDVTRLNNTLTSGGVHTSNGTRNIANGRSFFAGVNFNWSK